MPIALLIALAGSLGIHAAALFLPDVDLSTAPAPTAIQAEIQPPPKPPAPPETPPKAAEHPLPAKPAKAPARSAKSPVLTRSDAVPANPVPAPVAVPAPAPVEPTPPRPAEPLLPATGRIRFLVYRGLQGFEVGRAEHTWEFKDGAYRISIVTETSGLAAFFKPVRIELESRGRLAPFGLQPEHFTTRRNGAETNENAEFDWAGNSVTLARDGSRHALTEGTQDLVSFHYQLAYVGNPGGGVSMGVATGRKFERYRFESLGEEMVDCPAGRFRTLHVRVQTDSTTELWLSLDRQMLPVKIRYTDRKGEAFEQLASEMGQ